eukprot:TRINITY_DN11648_c0_g1_i20.p1 TRINITY_DN11648_c0_g1~~TRINITY_DN11648_c0_g1_i20.p1  ORF type:complete len:212 (+),score=39.14 TRINITY_DN11648_c0_g1_i20:309-944(+)
MSQFHSDKKLKTDELDAESAGMTKKSRSFCTREGGERKAPLRIFACAPDSEGSETQSESSEKLRVSVESGEEAKAEADPQMISPSEITARSKVENNANFTTPKKRRLFDDFNETCEKRKQEIKQRLTREQQLLKGSMEKHPNSLKRRIKFYTKSTFFYLMQKELSLNEVIGIFCTLTQSLICLLYTSDAADDSLRVDLGGRRIIKKKKKKK